MPERFDAIVVGAGLAGLAAANTMARQGMAVAVLERGEQPGSKNAASGILYRRPTEDIFPDCWQHAPMERPIVAQHLWVLDGHRRGKERNAPPHGPEHPIMDAAC